MKKHLLIAQMNLLINKGLCLLLPSLLLLLFPATAQENGFFHLYDSQDRSFMASSAVETSNGNIIVALFFYDGPGELALLSEDGALIKETLINDNGCRSGIEHLFQDPDQPDLFYGIGEIADPINQTFLPYIIHFDDKLNILSRKEVQLPDEYKTIRISRTVLTRNRKFMYAGALDEENDYHRLYMLISLDGEVEAMADIDTDAANLTRVDAICESPVNDVYFEYRNSYNDEGQSEKRLFLFDDEFVFIPINEYRTLDFWEQNTLHTVFFTNSANSTMTFLDDTTLLFSDRIIEYWHAPNGSVYSTDRSAFLFTTDLQGNIQEYYVDGSGNDTIDYPFHFNAIAKTKGNTPEKTYVFHSCYGYFYPPRPDNLITLTKTDRLLNPLWKHSYSYKNKYLTAINILTTNDGGCLMVGGAMTVENGHYDWFALKVNPEGMVNSNEIIVDNQIIFYPNPVGEELRLHCSPDITLKQVELYDMEGRRILSQRTGLEQIDMGNIPAGLYTLRVTIDDGTVNTNKVVKQ